MTLPLIGNRDARRIFLHRHLLSDAPQGPASGKDLLQLIQGLGFVQLDSINTVARAHDLILFSRRQRYRPQALKTLYERDGALFEHWTHDAAVIPMGYYPHWELRRQRDAQMLRQRYKNWHQHDFEGRFQTVLDQIRAQGPVSSSDVGQDEPRSNGGWWDWHPSKTALEYLWRAGALCVVGRDGFQKRYDLTERVIDAALCDPSQAPDEAQTIDWCCNGALDRLGFATPGELAAFWAHISLRQRRRHGSSVNRPSDVSSRCRSRAPTAQSIAALPVPVWQATPRETWLRPHGCACSAPLTRPCAIANAPNVCSASATG